MQSLLLSESRLPLLLSTALQSCPFFRLIIQYSTSAPEGTKTLYWMLLAPSPEWDLPLGTTSLTSALVPILQIACSAWVDLTMLCTVPDFASVSGHWTSPGGSGGAEEVGDESSSSPCSFNAILFYDYKLILKYNVWILGLCQKAKPSHIHLHYLIMYNWAEKESVDLLYPSCAFCFF